VNKKYTLFLMIMLAGVALACDGLQTLSGGSAVTTAPGESESAAAPSAIPSPVVPSPTATPDAARVAELLTRGENFRLQGRLNKALDAYNSALELDPENAEAYAGRGHVYLDLEDYDAALADEDRAIELDEDCQQAYYLRGSLYSEVFIDYDAAEADLTRAIELDPTDHQALNNRATVYLDMHEWERAIDDLDRALAIGEFAVGYYNRGYAYRRLDEDEQAVEDLTNAIALYPSFVSAYYERGAAYQGLQDHDAAVSDYITVLEMGFNDPANIRDRAFYMREDGEEALDSLLVLYDYLAELTPSDAYTYFCRGSVHEIKGNTQEAIDDYHRFLELQEEVNPDTYTVQNRLNSLGAGD
jgi:tetratricopeptide (TPR) repeat protein